MSTPQGKCLAEGCSKQTTLVCPTCKKLDLPFAFYCSDECFKVININ